MPQSLTKGKTTRFKRLCHSGILVRGTFLKGYAGVYTAFFGV